MKIGIDALWYYDGYSSLNRVTFNFVNSLLEQDTVNDYVIFLDKRFQHVRFTYVNKRIETRYVKTGSLRYNFFLKLVIFPYFTFRDKIDMLITQYYPSPFSRGTSVSFVYDVLFETYPGLFTKREKFQLWPQRILTRFADLVITISESEKQRLLHYGYTGKADNITVFHLAPDSRFKPLTTYNHAFLNNVREKFSLPSKYILYVGLLSGRKNLDNLLLALPDIDHSVPLVIAGNQHPSYASNHMNIIAEKLLNKRVFFTGFVDDDELSIIYAHAYLFCFPSLAEGFGLPPLEALACGVPVVASNRTSIPEICGDAAVYFDPERPDDIAEKINLILADQKLYVQKKAEALRQAKKFNWGESATRLLSFLNKHKRG